MSNYDEWRFQDMFEVGMKRQVAGFEDPSQMGGIWLNLGAGNQTLLGSIPLDYPYWNAEVDRIPYGDGEVRSITAFHFFEHLSGKHAIRMLRECERVLCVDGRLTIVVPHRLGSMAYHDLDHKSFWTEDTFRILTQTPYYDKNRMVPWRLKLRASMIAGIVERNLAIFQQFDKTE